MPRSPGVMCNDGVVRVPTERDILRYRETGVLRLGEYTVGSLSESAPTPLKPVGFGTFASPAGHRDFFFYVNTEEELLVGDYLLNMETCECLLVRQVSGGEVSADRASRGTVARQIVPQQAFAIARKETP